MITISLFIGICHVFNILINGQSRDILLIRRYDMEGPANPMLFLV